MALRARGWLKRDKGEWSMKNRKHRPAWICTLAGKWVISRPDDLDLYLAEASNLQAAVEFLAQDSREFYDNRHRAMLARRLKHLPLDIKQRRVLLTGILAKLAAGRIDEQFMDQARLCLRLDANKTKATAVGLLSSEKQYIRRCASRILCSGIDDEGRETS